MLQVIMNHDGGTATAYFNISGNVGVNSPNDPLDVALVELGYVCMGQNPNPKIAQDFKELARQYQPTGQYRGTPGEPLSQLILAHQRARGSRVDGHISRIKSGNIFFPGARGQELFMLAALCNNMREVQANFYPRIDLHQLTPAGLSAHIKHILVD